MTTVGKFSIQMRFGVFFSFLMGSILTLAPSYVDAHARLMSPAPRNNNAGIKTGPCGGLPRGAPTVVQAGSQLMVQWEETIEHPGRYILSWSFNNDQGFQQNVINANLPDITGNGNLPHRYSYAVTVPNQACETCTLQLIQSMEENPAAPTYYYSCADIRIVTAASGNPTPQPPTQTPPSSDPSQEGSLSSEARDDIPKPSMGGCGRVGAAPPGAGPFNGGSPLGTFLLSLLLLPLATQLGLRTRERPNRPRLVSTVDHFR